MNFNNLYYFKVLAGFQHYTKASEFLCITQPSLSHAISALEKEYGIKLFEKDGRNVKLSKYGRLLNNYVTRAFSEIETGNRLLSQFALKDAGFVDFSFFFVLGYQFIPKLIKDFHAHPQYQNITINLNQCRTNESIERLRDGSMDICMCAYSDAEPTITFTPVLQQPLVCIVSKDHPLARYDQVEISQLCEYPIIRYNDRVGEIQNIIDRLFKECSSQPSTQTYLDEEITMAGLVSTGINQCIAIVPDLKILDTYSIKKLALNHPLAYRKVYLAIANDRPMPGCVKTFYNFILTSVKIL